jgi:hypothetical protein
MFINRKQLGRWMVIAAAIGLFCCLEANAKKPPAPEEPGNNGGGVIYFRYDGDMYTMNDDGSGILPVAGYPADFRASTFPSRQRHADKRWFADMSEVPGEYYPDFSLDGSQKWGSERKMFILLSDANDLVLIGIDADLEPMDGPQWMVGDEYLSWVGRRWDIDPESPSYGTVLEGGIYATPLTFDESGDVEADSSLLVVPFSPLVPSYMARQESEPSPGPDIWSYDWAPDGGRFVFEALSTEDLWNGQIGGSSELFYGSGGYPKWSPAGDKIVFSDGGIKVINTDGSGLKTLARHKVSASVGGCVWSPTGSHLLYHYQDHFYQDSYIVRITPEGRDKTRLTDESMGYGYPGMYPWALGWRE